MHVKRTQEHKNSRTLLAVGYKHLADGIAGGDDFLNGFFAFRSE
jgi:hypothetical protein